MLTLRPYQEDMVNDTRKALESSRRVLLQAPTGAGKTAITVFMMGQAAARGKRSWFLVHQNELLTQTSKALWKQKLEHGMIASNKGRSNMPAQVASVQTLVRRLGQYDQPDLIIIDECHRSAATSYQKVLDAYPNSIVIGLTATPARTDGQGLDDVYDDIVIGPSIRQLMDAGYLSEYEIFAPPSALDLSHVKTRMGDFDREGAKGEIDKPKITGDAVATYKKHAHGKRNVVMCIDIEHANHVAETYRANGVTAEVIEGKMTGAQRAAMLDRFRSGETLVLCNVNLLIEGVDIPSIEVVQWLRPTQSLIIWMQGNGRGLRISEGKDRLVILDQVGNWQRHGLPDDDREWTLEGREKGKRRKKDDEPDVFVQQCASCFHVFRPGVSECPKCGAPVEKKKKREIDQVDGELVKLDLERERKNRRQEQGQARSLRDLVILGMRRGMKKPSAWAAITLCSRSGRKPTALEFKQAKMILMEVQGG